MAPRANGRVFCDLLVVTCPVALYPRRPRYRPKRSRFNQINRLQDRPRIKYAKVDADTGEDVCLRRTYVPGSRSTTIPYIEVNPRTSLEDHLQLGNDHTI